VRATAADQPPLRTRAYRFAVGFDALQREHAHASRGRVRRWPSVTSGAGGRRRRRGKARFRQDFVRTVGARLRIKT